MAGWRKDVAQGPLFDPFVALRAGSAAFPNLVRGMPQHLENPQGQDIEEPQGWRASPALQNQNASLPFFR